MLQTLLFDTPAKDFGVTISGGRMTTKFISDVNSEGIASVPKQRFIFAFGAEPRAQAPIKKFNDFFPENHEPIPVEVFGAVYRFPSGAMALIEDASEKVSGWAMAHTFKNEEQRWFEELLGWNPLDPMTSLHHKKSLSCRNGDRDIIVEIYYLNPKHLPDFALRIPDNDWKKSITLSPPLLNQLNPRQKDYILRLGARSGRDLVPIDLTMYRELLKLELIVDKGRRLALTAKGLDVFHHLQR